jgi:hypothetical protein
MSKAYELNDVCITPGVAWWHRQLQVALHYYQSVCRPLWLLLKQGEADLHGYGEWLFQLQGNSALSSWESVSQIKVIIWNKEPLMRFEMCLSKSKSHYDLRWVGQSILVLRPIWVSWPDINFCLTFIILSMSGAPSDGRSCLSSVLVTWTASVQ